jgi:nucleoid-associated protein YgaU
VLTAVVEFSPLAARSSLRRTVRRFSPRIVTTMVARAVAPVVVVGTLASGPGRAAAQIPADTPIEAPALARFIGDPAADDKPPPVAQLSIENNEPTSAPPIAVLHIDADLTAPAATVATTAPQTYVVQPGDHFWSIAESQLHAATSLAVTDDDVADYWLRLVDANRDRLVQPGDTDFLLPGQTVVLPSLP